jgi:uncharacterized protein (TIGR03089 family)
VADVITSFEQVLERRLRDDPGQPLVTFYDDATGERTELSATTYANWVAKTAGVLVDDLGLDAGDTVALDLPPHWLGPVLLGGTWLAGLGLVSEGAADVVVHGPAGTEREAGQRVGCALQPFAVAAREPWPGGVLDFGTLWPGQPDAFLGLPGGADDPAYDGADQATLLAAATSYDGGSERWITDLNPVGAGGIALFLGTLVNGGSVVWTARPDPELWVGRTGSERATRELRAAGGR